MMPMFDSQLFIDICRKYNVEFSETATEPMIKVDGSLEPVSENRMKEIFTSGRTQHCNT